MKKVLFIDRDGTLVIEPPVDYQLDAYEKLEFYPKVFRNLGFIRSKLDFEFAMVTNQDGLGTSSFPEDTFWPVHCSQRGWRRTCRYARTYRSRCRTRRTPW